MKNDIKKSIAFYKKVIKGIEREYGYAYDYQLLYNIFFSKKRRSKRAIRSTWDKFIKSGPARGIDFYVHLPFCFQKCAYCITGSKKINRNGKIDKYIDFLIDSIFYFKSAFSGVKFTNLYIGGGTPSILNLKLLDKLLANLFNNFQFSQDGEKTFELNPISSSFAKLKLLKKYGFNRVSFGVQSFNQKTLALNNRGYQTEAMVKKAIDDAKKAGFANINIDLIIGLYGDDKDSLIKSFKRAVCLDLASVSLYPLQPKVDYLVDYFNLSFNQFNAFLKRMVNLAKGEILEIAQNNDFLASDITAGEALVRNRCWAFRKKGLGPFNNYYTMQGDNSIFAVGYDSISIIRKIISYSVDSDGIYWATDQDYYSRMIYYVFEKLNNQRWISKNDFKRTFKTDIAKEFKFSLNSLKEIGAIRPASGDKIHLHLSESKNLFLYLFFFLEEKMGRGIFYRFINQKENKQKDFLGVKIIDGRLRKKDGNIIYLSPKADKKEIKVLFDRKTKFIKMNLSSTNKVISQTKIKSSGLKSGDNLSLVFKKNKGEDILDAVRKIENGN